MKLFMEGQSLSIFDFDSFFEHLWWFVSLYTVQYRGNRFITKKLRKDIYNFGNKWFKDKIASTFSVSIM